MNFCVTKHSTRLAAAAALSILLPFAGRSSIVAQPFGIEERAPNLELRINSPPGGDPYPVPQKLSDLPALLLAASGRGHEVAGVIPYEPSAKLWSDRAYKQRYLALPDYAYPAPGYARISFALSGGWSYPDDTVLVKSFELPLDLRDPPGSLRRIETRVLHKRQGAWAGYSYEWNEEGTDASLLSSERATRDFSVVGADGAASTQTWTYPSRDDCLQCHTAVANRVLGLTTPQMNHEFTYPASGVRDNQLRTLEHLGIFDAPLPAPLPDLPRMPDYTDGSATLDSRARAYLAANCSICHRPGAPVDADINLTWEARRQDLNAIDVPSIRSTAGLPASARIIYPGRPELSVLLERMSTLNHIYRMPRVGSRVVDADGVALIRDWILAVVIPAPQDIEGASGQGRAELEWTPVASGTIELDGYNVYRSTAEGVLGELLNDKPIAAPDYVDAGIPPATYYYTVKAAGEGRESAPSAQVQVVVTRAAPSFLRGNCSGDAKLDLSDAVFSLGFLFGGGQASSCAESCDSNGDGLHDVSDPIYTLAFLFLGGPAPGLFPACEPADESCDQRACPGG